MRRTRSDDARFRSSHRSRHGGVPLCWPVTFTLGLTILALALTVGCSPGERSSKPTAAPVVMAVTAVRARIAPMHREIRLLGTTDALRHLIVRAPLAGRVLGLNLQSGDRVRRGEVVAHIVNRESIAAENGLGVAEKIDPADAAALARSVHRYTNQIGVAVTVPQNAIVSQRLVSSGQMVADLDPLLDLVDPRSIYVKAEVPIDDLAEIKPGMSATITSPLNPGVAYPATVAALSPSFSQNGATSPARIDFTTPARIALAGAAVQVRIVTRSAPHAIVIPAAALFQDARNDAYYVFIAGADGRAHRRTITLGIQSLKLVQVLTGVEPGELVITSGGYALSDGLRIKVAAAQ